MPKLEPGYANRMVDSNKPNESESYDRLCITKSDKRVQRATRDPKMKLDDTSVTTKEALIPHLAHNLRREVTVVSSDLI